MSWLRAWAIALSVASTCKGLAPVWARSALMSASIFTLAGVMPRTASALGRVVAVGGALVEIMRPGQDQPLDPPGSFDGPFVSGAPAIFACACARLGTPAALAGTVGDDPFGRLIRHQAARDGLDASHVATDPRRPTGCAFVAYRSDGRRDFVFHVRDAAAGVVDPAGPPAQLLADVA